MMYKTIITLIDAEKVLDKIQHSFMKNNFLQSRDREHFLHKKGHI